MPSRIVREGIISSSRVSSLSMGAEVLYRRLINVADDYGRFHGAITTVIGACWPTNPDKIRAKDASKWLNELLRGDRPLVKTYAVAGATFLEIQQFDQQVRSKSRFPDPPWVESEEKTPSRVYFVQAEGSKKIKIGFTELKPKARLATLQIGSPEKLTLLGTFPGTMSDERETHKLFASYHIAGEWFSDSEELRAFIAEKCQQVASKPRDIPSTSRIRISESYAESKTEQETHAPNGACVEEPVDAATADNRSVVRSIASAKPRRAAKRSTEEIRQALGERLPWWEAFWTEFPCHDAIREAMDAYERKVTARELAEQVWRGAKAYRARATADPTMKLKFGQGWINGERWTDESARPTLGVRPVKYFDTTTITGPLPPGREF